MESLTEQGGRVCRNCQRGLSFVEVVATALTSHQEDGSKVGT